MITDTHAHITCDELYQNIHTIMENAITNNVKRIIAICMNQIELQRGLHLQQQYPMIELAFGFHPCDVQLVTEEDFTVLEEMLKAKKIIAIGEIGLDFHYSKEYETLQREYFIRQIQLANQYNVPILIHMRDATQEVYEIVKKYLKSTGIMHCYSGSYEMAQNFIDCNLDISLSGVLTFKNANKLLEVAKKIPLEHLFVETDCPYLAPHPLRGKRNEVSYIIHTFKKLCELKEMDEKVVSEQLEKNAQRLFYGKN